MRKLRQRNWSVEDIVALFEKYPNGIGAKYDSKRLAAEVKQSYNKLPIGGAAPSRQSAPPPPQGPVATPKSTPNPLPNPAPHALPTIRLEKRAIAAYGEGKTERALLGASALRSTRVRARFRVPGL